MHKKWSLWLAAAMLAFTFQTAMAQEEDEMDLQADVEEQFDDDFGPGGPRGWGPGGFRCGTPRRGPGFDRGGPGRGPGFGIGRGGHGPAMSHKGPGFGHGMGFGMGMMREMELTDAQKKQMIDVMTNNFRDRLTARMELQEAYGKLRDLHESDNPDHDAIIAANQAVGAANGKMDVVGRKFQDEMKAILTPEQQKKMEEFRRPRAWDDRDDRDGRPGRRMDRGPGRGGKALPPHLQRGPGPRVPGK